MGRLGFAAFVAEAGDELGDLSGRVDGDMLLAKEIAIFGSPEEVVQKIMRIKEQVG